MMDRRVDRVDLDGGAHIEPRLLEAKAHPAGTREKVNSDGAALAGRWILGGAGHRCSLEQPDRHFARFFRQFLEDFLIGVGDDGAPKNETGREVSSLSRRDSVASARVRVVADLSPFAVRPEGVNIVTLNGRRRATLLENRDKAEGYDVQNAVPGSLSALNPR